MDNQRRAHLRIVVASAIVAVVAPAAARAQPAVTVLHAFAGGTDGALPATSLIQATDGNFYGTTVFGGGGGVCTVPPVPNWSGCGTVFRMTPTGAVTILHAFVGGTDGAAPYASLIQAIDGNFYGTTAYGGGGPCGAVAFYNPNWSGCGTVFMMTPDGTVTIVHTFADWGNGYAPYGSLIQATDGNFYGTTMGGRSGGTVFQMTPAGTVTVLYAFTNEAEPHAALIQATDGNFYGTTSWVGTSNDYGAVFRMTPNGTVTILHAFAGGTDGAAPEASLIQATDGNFYGTTEYGGSSGDDELTSTTLGNGTVFRMTPSGTVTTVHAFAGGTTDGAAPEASLIQATDGDLYGTTMDFPFPWAGGPPPAIAGVVFELTLVGAPTITTQPQSQTIASGQTATLSVVASGSGLSYQWYVGTTGTTTSPIAGATESSYTTPALTSTTSYWVLVSNSVDTVDSTTATVIVAIVPGDFEGDAKTDLAVFRPSTGTWYIWEPSTGTTTGVQWGNASDVPVPGDYDGDGKTDIAVFRPSNGTWYIVYSSTGSAAGFQWGNGNDVLVPGDYNGDGKTDLAVFRPSNGTWYIWEMSTGTTTGFQWGNGLDVPVPGDYDGDGKTDIAVFRPSNGTWYIVYSSTGTAAGFQWGNASDVPVPGDYDGDGKTDIAVFRPSNGTWYIIYSSTATTAGFQWGNSSDVPVPGDYDGDGKTDLAVFRPSNGTWYIWEPSTGTTAGFQWGNGNDVPVLKAP